MTFDKWWEVEGHLFYNKAEEGHITWESVMNLAYVAGCESRDHQNLTSQSSGRGGSACEAIFACEYFVDEVCTIETDECPRR